MKPYTFLNQKKNYKKSNVGKKTIINVKRKPNNFNKNTHFGEKIQETNNYLLYSSGNQKSYYELFPQDAKIKLSKKNANNKLFNNKSFLINSNINNYFQLPKKANKKDPNKILNISENYGYKETLNITNNDPSLKGLTVHDMQQENQESQTPSKNMTQIMKIINNNVKVWKREFNHYSERNQGIRVVKENKSSDNIKKRKNNYRIKINNEVKPDNHKSKVVRMTKLNEGILREIYLRKYVKKNEYINYNNNYNYNNIVPCYISKYTKKSQEPLRYINDIRENKNTYFINNDYESNEYLNDNLNKTFGYNNISCGDEESKNIECPIHGNISIVIHKNHPRIKKQYDLYE